MYPLPFLNQNPEEIVNTDRFPPAPKTKSSYQGWAMACLQVYLSAGFLHMRWRMKSFAETINNRSFYRATLLPQQVALSALTNDNKEMIVKTLVNNNIAMIQSTFSD